MICWSSLSAVQKAQQPQPSRDAARGPLERGDLKSSASWEMLSELAHEYIVCHYKNMISSIYIYYIYIQYCLHMFTICKIMRNKDEKTFPKGCKIRRKRLHPWFMLRDAHWASNDFLIHSEGIVSSSRRRKERSGAGKTSMDTRFRFDANQRINVSFSLVWLWGPPLNNSYTLFKVGRKKAVPLGKKSTLK
jgi:hypothetical protein